MNVALAWSLVAGLVVCATLATTASLRDRSGRLVRAVPWVVASVATVAVAVVTWDETHVSQGELDDAVDAVAARLDGASYVVPSGELRRQVSEELGDPVDLYSTDDAVPDTPDVQQTRYMVEEEAVDGGPAACLTVTITRTEAGEPGSMTLETGSGAC